MDNRLFTGQSSEGNILSRNSAGATGLEPTASCVTGSRSNQLNYAPALKSIPCDYRILLWLPVHFSNFLKMP